MCFVGLEKLSLVDFDGHLSTVLFTEKCNIRCLFCQNTKLLFNQNKKIPWLNIKKFLIKNKKKLILLLLVAESL